MKLSAPVFLLKHQARLISREEQIPLHEALDRIAQREGFNSWSLLSARSASDDPAAQLLAQLRPGDLVLLASRPRQGKTLLSLEIAIRAMRQGHRAAFFTLEFTAAEVAERVGHLGEDIRGFGDAFLVDDSDRICADYIVSRLATAPAGTLVVVDYLQLLDQNRALPDLMHQVQRLRQFARERQLIVVCLSQIDRRFAAEGRAIPGVEDVRLPNPLDLGLFDRTCFLSRGTMQVASQS